MPIPLAQEGAALANDHLLFLVSLLALAVIFVCVWLLFREYFHWRRNMEIMLRRARQPLLIVVIVRKVFGRRAKVEKVIAGQLDEDFSPGALRRQINATLREPIDPQPDPAHTPEPPADPRLF